MVNPLSLDNTPSIVTKIVTRFAETSMNTGFWALAHKELKFVSAISKLTL